MFVGRCADAAQTCLNSFHREKKKKSIFVFLLGGCLFVSGAQTCAAGAKGEVTAAVVTKEPLPERGREVQESVIDQGFQGICPAARQPPPLW